MPDGILTFEHGEIRLGGRRVPGILLSQSIRGTVRFDEAEQDGLSGKTRTPMGWEDADICLDVELLTDDDSTCYDKLSELSAVFRGQDNGGNPKVYDVVNPHVTARGVERVVFCGLDSRETSDDDVILATLNFLEHIPPVTRIEKGITAADQAMGDAPATTETEPESDTDIQVDPGPFAAGFAAGTGAA